MYEEGCSEEEMMMIEERERYQDVYGSQGLTYTGTKLTCKILAMSM